MTTTLLTPDYTATGLPQHYGRYNGGTTRAAVLVYVRYIADPIYEREPTPDELRLVCEYLAYFIHAPAWKYPKCELEVLRQAIERITCAHELANWLYMCRTIGIPVL